MSASPPATIDLKTQRRLTRAARRAQQRLANPDRAIKMREARLEHEREAGAGEASAGDSIDERRIPKFNVGCSGWFYWHWKGRFYPEELPTKDWFAHYIDRFDTVELNAPFYSWPTVANVRSWVRQAQSRQAQSRKAQQKPFFYTVKVCELITHAKQCSRTATLTEDFLFIDRLLRPHVGCFLYQMPPSFPYSAARLKRVLGQLKAGHRNVVEFRHQSWWRDDVFAACKRANAIFCSCSAPKLPDELIKTSDEVYIRFHGKERWYRHDYSDDELSEWVKRIRKQKPKRVWAYFNNDFGANAPRNALRFLEMLGSKPQVTNRKSQKSSKV